MGTNGGNEWPHIQRSLTSLPDGSSNIHEHDKAETRRGFGKFSPKMII